MNGGWERIVEYIIGSVSIIGCFFVIVVFSCYKHLRNFTFSCVMHLTFSSMMTTISYFIYYVNPYDIQDDRLCSAQAFLMIMFENSQYIWTLLIAYGLYMSVVHYDEDRIKTPIFIKIRFLCYSYLIPFFIALYVYFRSLYGPSGNWCWIDIYSTNLEPKIISITFYIFINALILTNYVLYYLVIRYIRKEVMTEQERVETNRYIIKLMVYPFIQTLCFLPASMNRFNYLFLGYQLQWLQYTHEFFQLFQGLLLALVYGYTYQVRMAIYKTLSSCCCRKDRKESLSTINSHENPEGRSYSGFSSDDITRHEMDYKRIKGKNDNSL